MRKQITAGLLALSLSFLTTSVLAGTVQVCDEVKSNPAYKGLYGLCNAYWNETDPDARPDILAAFEEKAGPDGPPIAVDRSRHAWQIFDRLVPVNEAIPASVLSDATRDCVTPRGTNSFAFRADVPPGDYDVTVWLGNVTHPLFQVRATVNGQPIDTNQGDPNSWGKFGTEDAETLTSLNCPQNSFLSFNMNGMRYQLLYKPGSGATKVVRLNDDGLGVTTVWSDNWGQRWTHLVPFTLWGGQQHLFRYKASTGQVYFDRINSQGEGTTTLTSSNWWAGWTHFMPFALGGKPYFIAYDSLNGYANIDRIMM